MISDGGMKEGKERQTVLFIPSHPFCTRKLYV